MAEVSEALDLSPAKALAEENLDNTVALSLGYQLRRAANAMIADLSRRLAPLDLTVTKGSVLMLIQSNPGITQIQISRALGIKRANMVPLISSLERQGLIYKTRVDGRSQGLKLTDEGEETVTRAARIVASHEKRFQERISKDLLQGIFDEMYLLWEDE